MTREDQFKRGVEQFNNGYFFECHDTLEEIWMETVGHDRMFLQGLIQVSVGFYHLFNKNFKGAVSQFMKGLKKLDHYRPAHALAFFNTNGDTCRRIELVLFMEDVLRWKEKAEQGLRGEHVVLEESRVPKIRFIS